MKALRVHFCPSRGHAGMTQQCLAAREAELAEEQRQAATAVVARCGRAALLDRGEYPGTARFNELLGTAVSENIYALKHATAHSSGVAMTRFEDAAALAPQTAQGLASLAADGDPQVSAALAPASTRFQQRAVRTAGGLRWNLQAMQSTLDEYSQGTFWSGDLVALPAVTERSGKK